MLDQTVRGPCREIENELIEAFKNKQLNQAVYGHVHCSMYTIWILQCRTSGRRRGGREGGNGDTIQSFSHYHYFAEPRYVSLAWENQHPEKIVVLVSGLRF